jgi:hypothetical protein
MRSRRRRGTRRLGRRIRGKARSTKLKNPPKLKNLLLNVKKEKIVKRMGKSYLNGRKECVLGQKQGQIRKIGRRTIDQLKLSEQN